MSFQKVKDLLSSPLTIILPVKGLLRVLYLAFTNKSNGVLLAHEAKRVKHI